MFKILLLEDDALFSDSLHDFLSEEGFIVDIAKDGQEALNKNYSSNYDLYLLDINVPKINGLDLLKNLRESGDNTPAIFLTSYKDKETLSDAFLFGADDYLKKPLDLNELLLRINALFKRCGKDSNDIKLLNNVLFNIRKKRLIKDNLELKVPIKILDLLGLFCENRDKIVTKDMIIERLWCSDEEYSEGSIRVYVNNLKKILGKESIINIKGIGYKVEF